MMHCLVTFLGRTQRKDSSGKYTDGTGYSKASYQFPDGHIEKAAFIGYPLQKWLKADRLVVLGTAGSMWDHLVDSDISVHHGDNEICSLIDAVDNEDVDQALLDALTPQLAAALNCEVALRIVPDALKEADQIALVQVLADAAEGAEVLSIDVTHGYRHLPMLALTAALYLRGVRPDLRIDGLWYGAHDPSTKTARVSKVGGLLSIFDWVSALQRFDLLNDYGAIGSLIDDRDISETLKRAAFLESIHQGYSAKQALSQVRSMLTQRPLNGAGTLFQPLLEERLRWIDSSTEDLRQLAQAREALKRQDLLRGALWGFEAYITRLTRQREGTSRVMNERAREAAKNDYEKHIRYTDSTHWQAYERLKDARNVLAHGGEPQTRTVKKALRSADALRALIEQSLNILFAGARA